MKGQQTFESAAPKPEQADRYAHRCYSAAQIIAFLNISPRSFFALKRRGQLPFLEELRPRLGRSVRYRADLIDRYLAGEWAGTEQRRHGKHLRVSPHSSAITKSVSGF